MSDLHPYPKSIHETLREIIAWSAEAAREHVERARWEGSEPDPDGSMGLWQSFQARWPKEGFVGNYELAVTVYGATFSAAVKELAEATKDANAGRCVPPGQRLGSYGPEAQPRACESCLNAIASACPCPACGGELGCRDVEGAPSWSCADCGAQFTNANA
jgi:ribosomal protein L37AE/L43A